MSTSPLSPTISRVQQRSLVTAALQRDRLGAAAVAAFLMGGLGVMLVTAGVMPTFLGATGLVAIPVFFAAGGVILILFAVPYIAMGRRVRNAGAFSAMAAAGLGKPLGVSAALLATVSYNLLVVSLYGIFGGFLSGLSPFGLHAAWWVWGGALWLAVSILGLLEVNISGKVLFALSLAEVVVLLVLDGSGLWHPAPGGLSSAVSLLSPTHLIVSGAGAAGVIVGLGFIGFEGALVLNEEVRDHKRTLIRATIMVLVGATVLYVLTGFAYQVHNGDQLLTAAAQGPGMLFSMTNSSVLADIAETLFATSMLAAALAFFNYVNRYGFSLGREGVVLSRRFAKTGRRSGAPYVASLWQSAIGLAVIVGTVATGSDPINNLFLYGGAAGGFGLLCLFALTAVGIVVYFARKPKSEAGEREEETVLVKVILPVVTGAVLITAVVFAVLNFDVLLGKPGFDLAWVTPAIFGVLFVIGIPWALIARVASRERYDSIGLGASALTSSLAAA